MGNDVNSIAARGGDPRMIDTPDEGTRTERLLRGQIGQMSAGQVAEVRGMCAEDITLYGVFGDKAEMASVEANAAKQAVQLVISTINDIRGGEPIAFDLEGHPFPQPETYLHQSAQNSPKGKADPQEAYRLWKEAVTEWKNNYIAEVKGDNHATLDGISDQVTDVGGKVGGVSAQVQGVSDQVTGVSDQVAGVSDQVAGVSDQVAGVSGQVAGVSDQVAGVSDQVAGVSGQVAGVSNQIEAQVHPEPPELSEPSIDVETEQNENNTESAVTYGNTREHAVEHHNHGKRVFKNLLTGR